MSSDEKLVFEMLCEESQLDALFDKTKPELFASDPFVLALDAPMGAGKTTWVREFLRYCGLSNQTPVRSPTYTICNEYKIADLYYAHLDLYRAELNFSFEELGLSDRYEHRGLFIEWPYQAAISLDYTHRMSIKIHDSKRLYSFYRLLASR